MHRAYYCSVLLLGVLVVTPAAGQGFDRGQALYENHCQGCHDTGAHLRGERRATSREDIRRWVTSWSFHAGLGWSVEEVEDVTGYLDRRFYRFSGSP